MSPDERRRYLDELRLGVCLLFLRKYAEARPLLTIAFNHLRVPTKTSALADRASLREVIRHLADLRDDKGQLVEDRALRWLRDVKQLQPVLLDCDFPEDPFGVR